MPEIFYSTGAHVVASPQELLFFAQKSGQKIPGIMGIPGMLKSTAVVVKTFLK